MNRGREEDQGSLSELMGPEPTVRIEPQGDSPRDSQGDRQGEPRADHDRQFWAEADRRRGPLLYLLLGVVALLLVLGAFGIGRLVAEDSSSGRGSGWDASGTGGETAGDAGQAPKQAGPKRDAEAYAGPVDAVAVAGSSATCQTADSVDGRGNPTSYAPSLAHDSDLTTAWRCDGRGQGQRFTASLAEPTVIAEVGLVPGYAKTDPGSGVDRYAENNRITRVRWIFEDGTEVVQRMGGAADDRSMRTKRVPRTTTGTVVIEILDSTPGARNTVAISEIRLARPAG